MRIQVVEARKKLTKVWFIWSLFLLFILIFQSILGRYENKTDEAWAWLLPSLMPTLSLIVGVLVTDKLGKSVKQKTVDGFIFKLSFILSIVYLFMVTLTILLSPFVESIISPLMLMMLSNLWLGPFQGIVSAAIGAFFVYKE